MLSAVPAPVRHDMDILVIGSDDQTAAYFGLLRASGWRVGRCAAMRRAIVPCACPRLILLCGWEVVQAFIARSVRVSCAWDTVVVAYCPPDTDLTAEALDHGIDLVIASPCSPPLLIRRVRAALRWTVP